ncbi:MAG TPA: ATP synthase F1 subunit delta [Acidobacteriaceae bacterium]
MSAFAARYARALADVIESSKLDPAQALQQLEDFAVTFHGSKDLQEILLNPSLPAKKRVEVLDAVNRRVGAAPKVRNFLAVLIQHERLISLGQILEQFRLEMNRRLGISEVQIISSRPLDGQERSVLEDQVAALAGNKVRATFREDASLIGGVIVRLGSTVYDGSVRGRLERLKSSLMAD